MHDHIRDVFGKVSRDVRDFHEREERAYGRDHADRVTRRALIDAKFGEGELAGRTGDRFKDDPFFNPWAKGGTFNP